MAWGAQSPLTAACVSELWPPGFLFVRTILPHDDWPVPPELAVRFKLIYRSHETCYRLAPHRAQGRALDLLTLVLIALVISIIAGVFGFTGIASGAATVAKGLFGVFLVIAVVVFLFVVLGVSLAL